MRRWYEPRNNRPDVPKDAPKKKGIVRFFEALWREFFTLLKLNLLFLISCIPIVTIPAALTALSRITVTIARDESCFLWHEYWKAFRRDFGKSLVGGLVLFASFLMFGVSVWFYYNLGMDNRFFIIVAGVAACILLCVYMTSLYFFPMLSVVDLPTKKLLKNSFVIVFVNIKYSLAAMALCLMFTVFGLGLLPNSAPFVLLIQFSLTSMIASFLLYPGIAKRVLGIQTAEEQAREQAEEEKKAELQSAEIGDFPEYTEDDETSKFYD